MSKQNKNTKTMNLQDHINVTFRLKEKLLAVKALQYWRKIKGLL